MANSTPLISISHLTVAYDNLVALEDATLTIFDHDFLGIIGLNGGGKTTLIKAILGLLPFSQGEITFFDEQGKKVPSITMGYLPQYSSFDFRFPITVEEVVRTGLLARKSPFFHYTKKQTQQADYIIKILELDHLASRPIGELSGGQRQRVLLARALVNHPRLLILDEPSTYIDKESEGQMYSLLKKLNSYCAILLVSHDMGAVLQTVRNIACVNRSLHYHPASEPAETWFEQDLGCPLELVAHGHLPHRILSSH